MMKRWLLLVGLGLLALGCTTNESETRQIQKKDGIELRFLGTQGEFQSFVERTKIPADVFSDERETGPCRLALENLLSSTEAGLTGERGKLTLELASQTVLGLGNKGRLLVLRASEDSTQPWQFDLYDCRP